MNVLLDTGPLVAIISRDDSEHARCVRAFQSLISPPLTCWPVLTEAAWLLRHNLEHVETLLNYASEGIVSVAHLDVVDFSAWLQRFFATFRDQQPQLADAALMYLADRRNISTVFTLDRRDFLIYRTSKGRSLTILP